MVFKTSRNFNPSSTRHFYKINVKTIYYMYYLLLFVVLTTRRIVQPFGKNFQVSVRKTAPKNTTKISCFLTSQYLVPGSLAVLTIRRKLKISIVPTTGTVELSLHTNHFLWMQVLTRKTVFMFACCTIYFIVS